MTARINFVSRCAVASLLFSFLATQGCGGGTTGTSSTGELRLLGQVEQGQAEGYSTPASNKPMTVYSGSTEQELVSAATDNEGRFEMVLPGEETSVVVEIEGERSTPVNRVFSGSSIVVTSFLRLITPAETKLGEVGLDATSAESYLSERAFVAPDTLSTGYSLRYNYELWINPDTLCQRLSSENNVVRIEEPIGSESCDVNIHASSPQISKRDFRARLSGVCDGSQRVLFERSSNDDGVLSIGIGDAYRNGCTSLEIAVWSRFSPNDLATIPVTDKQ